MAFRSLDMLSDRLCISASNKGGSNNINSRDKVVFLFYFADRTIQMARFGCAKLFQLNYGIYALLIVLFERACF